MRNQDKLTILVKLDERGQPGPAFTLTKELLVNKQSNVTKNLPSQPQIKKAPHPHVSASVYP